VSVDVTVLAEELAAETAKSANEIDLRVRIEPLIDKARVGLGVTTDPEREKTLDAKNSVITIRGRADTMYGGLVIEYESPGVLATAGGLAHAAKQAREYMLLSAASSKPHELDALRRHAGIVFDGRQVGFLRATGPVSPGPLLPQLEAIIPLEGPYPLNAGSVSQLLLYLRALGRKRLDGRSLAQTFGPEAAKSPLAREFVAHLLSRLADPTIPAKARLLYDEWMRSFGAVYAQDAKKARQDAGLLAKLYGVPSGTGLPALLFCVQTYYALLMKLLAVEVLSLQAGSLISSQASKIANSAPADRALILADLEAGSLFAAHGIENFLEADYFGWYLEAWNSDTAEVVQRLAEELTQFEPATSTLDPDAVRDLLKDLYQYLVPKKVRHDLGEYYTPDWLADYTLDQAGYNGDLAARVLDPACGSGTFLIRAIGRIRQHAAASLVSDEETAKAILNNVVGFDLNPVAVLAARTNYLLALGPLLRKATPLSLPVYLADSLLAPLPYSRLIASPITTARSDHLVRGSSVGDFKFPIELADKDGLRIVTEELERGVQSAIGLSAFVARVQRRRSTTGPSTSRLLEQLYTKVERLATAGKNGIWARLLRNAFAPSLSGRFEYVVGNPPWINWESLSDEYRRVTARLWELHGLFTLEGFNTILGGSKRDIAMLFWSCCADYYLADGGTIAFLFPQTAFQTSPAGDGFRRFALADTTPVGPKAAADLVAIQPFEGASNWTGLLVGERGRPPAYPIPYVLWTRKAGSIPQDADLTRAVGSANQYELFAAPSNPAVVSSPWVIGTTGSIAAAQRMSGKTPYRPRAGITTWADGIYYGTIGPKLGDGRVTFTNDASRAKRTPPRVRPMAIEADFIYPFIEWRDVKPFSAAPHAYILVPQDPATRRGYSESGLRVTHPGTYDYLSQFRPELEKRSGFRRYFTKKRATSSDAFYSIFNFGTENLAPVRVVWATMGTFFRAAVVEMVDDPFLGKRSPQVKNTVIFAPVDTLDEAHYLCALLNSAPLNYLASFSSVRGGKSFGSGGFFDRVRIDAFRPGDAAHRQLADASQRAHDAVATGNAGALAAAVADIDLSAGGYWGLSANELDDMRRLISYLGAAVPEGVDEEEDTDED
jgi:SAM-dependent methyltransferase